MPVVMGVGGDGLKQVAAPHGVALSQVQTLRGMGASGGCFLDAASGGGNWPGVSVCTCVHMCVNVCACARARGHTCALCCASLSLCTCEVWALTAPCESP